ncbi:hypothetical protein HPB48_020183 [Haemaphysalis longicornis]|uniref:peptide-methionine (S)-S-oxide reductase n=1 Tax=Haemaphysalis longicornis TaxID=44386 RepID=A0A9J6FHX1_HAELO|nr:hypothetical protein HPB48_020183 [Haemaphysalis longicornis]
MPESIIELCSMSPAHRYCDSLEAAPSYTRSTHSRRNKLISGDYTEVTRVEYDPSETNFNELLKLFWAHHDPTRSRATKEYMSAIFFHDGDQEKVAKRSLEENRKNFKAPIVTQILTLENFYLADESHQKYRLQRQAALYRSLVESGMKDVTRSHVATRLNGYVGGFGTVAAFDAESHRLGLSADQINAVRALIRKGTGR